MPDPTSADAIADAAQKIRDQLTALDDQIDTAVNDVRTAAAREKRPLNSADNDRIDALRARQKKVRDAFDELAFATTIALDNSDDVKRLQDALGSINAGLADDLNRLKKIAETAAIAAQVADGLARLAQQVAALAAKGAV